MDTDKLFAELFRGRQSCYGVHKPAEIQEEGQKAKGVSFTKNEAVSAELYKAHILGICSIGIVPIDENGNIRFAAIDVDIYPSNPKNYCYLIEKYGLPLVPFRSKSGGLHLFCFFSSDTPAGKVLDQLNVLRHLLMISKEAEMFPKQRFISSGGSGNFINLPYFGGDETKRYAYDSEGKPLGLEAALKLCYNRRVSLKELEAVIQALPLSAAPPCLQTLLMNNGVSVTARNRNTFLFNCAVYLKARWKEEFPEKLQRINALLDRPLDEQELDRTIISSHRRGNYSYQCSDPSLKLCCNKELCKSREYGKETGTVSNFVFEKLVQVKTASPYYRWRVNGVEMVFFSESELRTQEKFMDLCMRDLHRLPNKLKAEAWTAILNSALQEMEVEDVEKEAEISDFALWSLHLKEYLTERAMAQTPGQVKMGLTYKDEDGYYFRVEHFLQWLESAKRFKLLTLSQTHYQLRKMGACPKKLYDAAIKRAFRAWFCAVEIIDSIETSFGGEIDESSNETEGGAGELKSILSKEPPEKDVQENDQRRSTRGVTRLNELLGDLSDEETLDFSQFKEEEKF